MMNQHPTEKQSLAEKSYALIEEMIVTLKLTPGSHFSEGDLSHQLRIGRTPIREALQRLAADRLIATVPRRGMFVTEINITEHLALLETRRVLDRLIASRAAKRAGDVQRARLRDCASEIVGAAAEHDLDRFMRLDRQCDEIIEQAARNPFAARAGAPLHAHCRRFWYRYQENGDLPKSARLHADVMQAVVAGNESEAAEASDRLTDYLVEFARAAIEF